MEDRVERLIAAEQDERRRLANELHDGAVQSLSGIALMLDAAQHSITEGRLDEASGIIAKALERHRDTIRELRDLSFALEPVILRDQGEMLTGREREILQLLADGMSNADVAEKLFISQETVKSHVRHILTKLEADTRTHAVAIALREAIID